MTQVDLRYLAPVLTPKFATPVETEPERRRLAQAVHAAQRADGPSAVTSAYISQTGRVLGVKLPSGERLLYEGEIVVNDQGGWKPSGKPRLYRVGTDEDADVRADARRLFLAHSLRSGGARLSAGWRSRVVALIPEEVGPKEAKVFRTLADGSIGVTHTYNVLDAYGTYAGWLHDLAMEFGSTDAVVGRSEPTDWTPEGAAVSQVRTIVQAWLMREAADAELQQARHTLKFALAAQAHLLGLADRAQGDRAVPPMSIAELSRSLYTDRPNLNRIVKASERDHEVAELFASLSTRS